MDTRHKALLMQHRPFLARNIVWSPELVQQFKTHGLLTDYMIKDIESCQSREEKVTKFIEILPLKGTNNFNKLLDILQISGHVFIADFLREDEDVQKLFDVEEMYKQLPFVKQAFNQKEKKLVETYFHEKIEAQVLKLLWKRDNREKDKAVEARMQQIEQAYEYEGRKREASKMKAETIAKLESEITAAMDDKTELTSKLKALSAFHDEQEKKHKEALSVQMKYNNANDNALQRANDKVSMMQSVLGSIKTKLDKVMKIHKEKHIPVPGAEGEEYTLEMIKEQGQFFFLNEDVDMFIRKFKEMMGVQKLYDQVLEEKDYLLVHFGVERAEGEERPNLIDAFKPYVIRNEENMQRLRDEVEKYSELLKDNEAKIHDLNKEIETAAQKFAQGKHNWQSAMMTVMRNQLNDLKSEIRKKDSLASIQEKEVTKLKKRIAELEATIAATARPGRASVVGIQNSADGDFSNSVLSASAAAAADDSLDMTTNSGSQTPKGKAKKDLPPLSMKASYQTGKNIVPREAPRDHSPVHAVSPKPRGVVTLAVGRSPQPEQQNPPKLQTFQMGLPDSRLPTQQHYPLPGSKSMGSLVGDLRNMNRQPTQQAKSFFGPAGRNNSRTGLRKGVSLLKQK